jgi:hypothetical protein
MGRKLTWVLLESTMWLGSLRRVFRSLRFFILLLTLFVDPLLAPRPLTLRQQWFLGRPPGDYFTRSLSIYICCKLKSNPRHTNRPLNNFHSAQYALPLEQRALYAACIEYIAGILGRQAEKGRIISEAWGGGAEGADNIYLISIYLDRAAHSCRAFQDMYSRPSI